MTIKISKRDSMPISRRYQGFPYRHVIGLLAISEGIYQKYHISSDVARPADAAYG